MVCVLILTGGCDKEDGSFIPDGHTSKDRANPCLLCTCLHNSLTCREQFCPQVDRLPGQECRPYYIPGQCCPQYECVTTGLYYDTLKMTT